MRGIKRRKNKRKEGRKRVCREYRERRELDGDRRGMER